MPTNEERDDLKPTLKQILELRRNPNQNTVTLSTAVKEAVNEINKLLKPFDTQLTANKDNSASKTSTTVSATLTTEAAAQLMNKLNNNPLLQAMGQSIAQKMGQTPGSTLPNPFNTGTPKLERK